MNISGIYAPGQLACLVLAFVGTAAQAQALTDFRCTIDRVVPAPALPQAQLDFLRHSYVGKEFTVERKTGVMAGVKKMHSTTQPQVIDIGGDQNSFKVVTTMRRDQGAGAGSNVYVLVVNTFDAATKKPFLFTDNAEAYIGTCVPF
ncbi:hypothetical protein LJR175_008205 [Variovorax sp. LjRoot175]|uniref:hypothetical protein n=1 Tax=Variovorax sp. LjRoot175 TaxID=3342276 RepID=UPI003ECDD745